MTKMKAAEVKKVVVIIEMEDSTVRQVLSTREMKMVLLNLLQNEKGYLAVSGEMEPLEFKFKGE